jgi:hypothetical protein
MGFDSRKNIQRTADAESFTARITEGTSTVRADITYKKSYKIGPPSITTSTMDQLMDALAKQDRTVKFYKTGSDAGTLNAKDATALENLRTDLSVSDVRYRSACRAFGQKPQPRPTQATTLAAQTAVPSLMSSAAALADFEREHGELFQPPYGHMNLHAIEAWFVDEGAQWTAANLAKCYAELKSFGCFRDARTLSRDMNGSMRIVRNYDRAAIVVARRQQVLAQQNAAPSNLSEVDAFAWNYVVQNHPGVPVGSQAFKQLCSQQVLAWAKDYAIEADPSLAAADKRGQLSVAINKVLVAWSRNPNLGQGQKTIKDTRVWLG